MPEPTRQYIFTQRQIKGMFAAVTILMIVVLVALLLLISARPQGSYTPFEDERYLSARQQALEELREFRELENGVVQIDIDRAIELVVERGVTDVFVQAEAPEEVPVAVAPEEEPAEVGLPDGREVYGSCAGCHQASGEGVPGAFPPLAGHAADLFEADPEYLALVTLFGLQGPIVVEGTQYNGLMPPWHESLSDSQIAAVLNYILSTWDNEERVEVEEPYSAEDITALRDPVLSPQEVHELRAALDIH